MTARRRVLLTVAIPILVVLVIVAAWAIDTSQTSGRVPRNVTLAGEDVGRLPEERLADSVRKVAQRYAATNVQVKLGAKTYEVPALKLGLELDENRTIDSALDLDTGESLVKRPVTWLSSFASDRKAPLHFTVDDSLLTVGLQSLLGASVVRAVEPKVVSSDRGLAVVSGATGRTVDPNGVRDQLISRAESGELPIVIRAQMVDRNPTVSDQMAKQWAASVNKKTANGLKVTAGQHVALFAADTVRSWLGAKVAAGKLELTMNSDQALHDLRADLPAPTTARNASITLVGDHVQITPSRTGAKCCAADTASRMVKAIKDGTGAVTVAFERDHPSFGTADAQKLGIKEPVGTTTDWKGQAQVKSFTTYYACCAARVTNIHHIADAVRGTIVKPGETFSLNGRVGQRTTAKGYVEAPVIYDGKEDTDVGGGVSQFSTTLFNAAFFAGMDFVSYQSHTIHFDRYPFGREATLGWEYPDQKWKNNTPYGVMIWTSYTDTSVTVTLWSTQNVYGQQTAQSTSKVGPCTKVRTQRTRTWADGHKSVDYVGSLYRPAEGVKCPGL